VPKTGILPTKKSAISKRIEIRNLNRVFNINRCKMF
jgi:hypothetical protein